MFSGQIAFYADNCVADERLVTQYEKLAALVSFVVGETVWKVKHSSVRIENPLLALYMGRSISVSRVFFGLPGGGDCLNGQTFLSENQEFALDGV